MHRDTWIVIPACNEAPIIGEVIAAVKQSGFPYVIVVDDGSNDATKVSAENAGALCLRHRLNRGKGAATKTGIAAASGLGAHIIVTMDGDGQHVPNDIPRLIAPLQQGVADVVLGTRLLAPQAMPRTRRIANQLSNVLTWLLYGLLVTDSQSGFRAYSQRAFELINTQADRYAYDSEVIKEIRRHKLRFVEVPITVRYTEYSLTKPYRQTFGNGVRTVGRMLWNIVS